jgi:hypothetical protein
VKVLLSNKLTRINPTILLDLSIRVQEIIMS